MKCRIVFVLLCVAFISCRSGSKYILPPDTMKVVMWDMLKADELYNSMLAKDTMVRHRREDIRLYEEIFAMHHITKKQFDSTYKYYESHPPRFKILIDSLEALASRETNRVAVPGAR